MLLASPPWGDSQPRATAPLKLQRKQQTVTVAGRARGDAGAVFDVAANPGWVSDQ